MLSLTPLHPSYPRAAWMPLGLSVPYAGLGAVSSAAASTDQWAYDVTRSAAPNMPEAQRQYAIAVARGEGYYGKGWTGDGAGSNNWGAVQGSGSAGSFQHVDHHADGSSYTTAFKRYATPQEGFLDMANILLKQNVKAALARGNLHDAVYAQHSNFYFELAPDKYLSAVVKNYGELTSNLGWPRLLSENGTSSTLTWLAAGFLMAGGLTWYALATPADMRRLPGFIRRPLSV